MKPLNKANIPCRATAAPLAALFLTTLGAAAAITVIDDDLVLKDRDLPSNPEDISLYFAEDDTDAGSNALYSWQSEQGAWVWGYDADWWTMFLSEDHVLKLYNTDTTAVTGNAPSIILNPGDGALGLVPASITIDGDKVITEGNSVTLLPTLLASDFVPAKGVSTSLGSVDSFLLEGTHGGPGAIPREGAGSRMMWYPEQSAFRAGYVSGNSWDDVNIGEYSIALGYDTVAQGSYSFAAGFYANATGVSATAFSGGYAQGDYSTAIGGSAYTDGEYSLAGGLGYASGYGSVALGGMVGAYGDYTTALGNETSATSVGATAIGYGNEDRNTAANASTVWQGDDEHSVFEVGIGDWTTPKNAFTILQDGSIELGNKQLDGTYPLHILADGTLNAQGQSLLTTGNAAGALAGSTIPGTLSVTGGIDVGGSPVLSEANAPTLLANDFIQTGGSVSSNGSSDSFLLEGTHGGSGSIPFEGTGTRMMWYPEKSAFRVGYTDEGGWDDANIGEYSVAMGSKSRAPGVYAAAFGYKTKASGQGSMTWGTWNVVESNALFGTAWGQSNTVNGNRGTAWGRSNTIPNSYGGGATVWGEYNVAEGGLATVSGTENTTQSFLATVMGRGNVGGRLHWRSPYTWYEVDTLLEVANGEDSARSNALTVLKNGQTTLTNKHWKAAVDAGGDITDDIVATSAEVPDENGSDLADPNEYYSHGNALVAEGHAEVKGNIKVDGTATLMGDVILDKKQGDISMGVFGN